MFLNVNTVNNGSTYMFMKEAINLMYKLFSVILGTFLY